MSIQSFIILGLFSFFSAFSQSSTEGIQFIKGKKWDEVLTLAKAQKKLIFVDAYAVWCGPCKMMDQRVFSQPDVGEFFNKNFIPVKIDMEKGEGPELARKFKIRGYPTFLFVDGSGAIVHKTMGFQPGDQLIKVAKEALNPESGIGALQKRFESGDRDPDFLYEYAYASYQAENGQHHAAAQAYLNTQDDWSTAKNMDVIFLFVPDTQGALYNYIINNKAAFIERYGDTNFDERMQVLILEEALGGDLEEAEALAKVGELFEKVFPDDADYRTRQFKMLYFEETGQYEAFAEQAVAFFNQYPSDNPFELNNIAWTFYQHIDDETMLRKAIAWTEQSVKMDDAFFNNDTLAWLLYKVGEKEKALKVAEHALELGKASDSDVEMTLELIEKIKG